MKRKSAIYIAASVLLVLLCAGCGPFTKLSRRFAGLSGRRKPVPEVQAPASGAAGERRLSPQDSTRLALMDLAAAQIGKKYRYGGIGPDVFDCSGLMYFVFASAGVPLPRSSAEQFRRAGTRLDPDEPLMPCDLVFFSGSEVSRTEVGHVGMVIDYDAASGSFTFIHAPRTGVEIQRSTSDYYARRYIGAARVLDR